jgi:hypothetical protein
MMLLGALNYSYIWYDPAGAIGPETYADMTVDAFIAGFGRPALGAPPLLPRQTPAGGPEIPITPAPADGSRPPR